MSAYKYCAVPLCTNTTIKTPNKLFIHVPKSIKLRNKWLDLAWRDLDTISSKTTIHFCEDHFNLSEDMDNYMEYRVMGSIKYIRLKPNCLPSKFSCQPDRMKRTALSISKPVVLKKQRMSLLKETEITLDETAIATTSNMRDLDTTFSGSHCSIKQTDEVKLENKFIQSCPELENKLIQNYPDLHDKLVPKSLISKFRSKSTPATTKIRNAATSPIDTWIPVAIIERMIPSLKAQNQGTALTTWRVSQRKVVRQSTKTILGI